MSANTQALKCGKRPSSVEVDLEVRQTTA